MALSDTKLRSIHGKPYPSSPEVSDADSLSARIFPKGVITFQYRYRWGGKPHRLGLGRYPSLSLKDARNLTEELRQLYSVGKVPRMHLDKVTGDDTMTVGDFPKILERTVC